MEALLALMPRISELFSCPYTDVTEDLFLSGSEKEFLLQVGDEHDALSVHEYSISEQINIRSDAVIASEISKGEESGHIKSVSKLESVLSDISKVHTSADRTWSDALKHYRRVYLVGILLPEERRRWDVYVLFLMCWTCIVSPYVICFTIEVSV